MQIRVQSKIKNRMANSVDPDETAHNLIRIFIAYKVSVLVCRAEGVKFFCSGTNLYTNSWNLKMHPYLNLYNTHISFAMFQTPFIFTVKIRMRMYCYFLRMPVDFLGNRFAVQSNFEGSNPLGTMKICSRQW